MRSHRRVADAQDPLPMDLPAEPQQRRRPQATEEIIAGQALADASSSPAGPRRPLLHRMSSDALASRGWPPGTELLIDPERRPQRGDVALVIDRGRRIVGVFGLQLGRLALHTDAGAHWLGPTAEVLGVVVQADAPLH